MNMAEALPFHGLRGALKLDEPMSRYVSWRAGGPAERLYVPADLEDLAHFLRQLPPAEPLLFVGLGSNLLVRDLGWRGTVVLTHGASRRPGMDGGLVYAEAGVASPKVARFSAQQHLEGRLARIAIGQSSKRDPERRLARHVGHVANTRFLLRVRRRIGVHPLASVERRKVLSRQPKTSIGAHAARKGKHRVLRRVVPVVVPPQHRPIEPPETLERAGDGEAERMGSVDELAHQVVGVHQVRQIGPFRLRPIVFRLRKNAESLSH